MSTRLYLSASTAAVVTPIVSGSWGYTSEEVARACTHAPDGTAIASGTVIGPWSPGQTASDRRYVTSLRLAKNQRIEGTITAMARALEVNGTDNVSTRFEAYVVSEDGQTVRGTLLAIGSYGSGAELNTSLRNIYFANAASVTPVDALVNDRIVCVFGYSDSSGTTPEAQASWGASHANAIDLPTDETTATAYNPWIEFSQDLIFELDPTGVYDSNDSSTVTLSGSNVTSFTKIAGSQNVVWTQSTSGRRPVVVTDSSKTVISYNWVFGDWDYMVGSDGDFHLLFPSEGHCTIMIEFKCTDVGALNTQATPPNNVGVFGQVNGDWTLSCNLVRTSTGVYSFRAGTLTNGFATFAADTPNLLESLWYVGTYSQRGQTLSSQVDARAPVTTTLGSTTGIDWGTTLTPVIGGASDIENRTFIGRIRRIAFFPRYLNPYEAGLARQTYFNSGTNWTANLLSVGKA